MNTGPIEGDIYVSEQTIMSVRTTARLAATAGGSGVWPEIAAFAGDLCLTFMFSLPLHLNLVQGDEQQG